MTTAHLTSLFLFAFVASITPGPNNIMLMTSGVNFGFRASVPHLFGVWCGVSLLMLLLGGGVYGLLQALPWLYALLHVLALIYLVYLAWRIATAGSSTGAAAAPHPLSFLQAGLFQLINPKAWTMGLAAVTTFARPLHLAADVTVIAAVFALMNAPSLLIWNLSGTVMRRALTEAAAVRIFNMIMAALLLLSLLPILLGGLR